MNCSATAKNLKALCLSMRSYTPGFITARRLNNPFGLNYAIEHCSWPKLEDLELLNIGFEPNDLLYFLENHGGLNILAFSCSCWH